MGIYIKPKGGDNTDKPVNTANTAVARKFAAFLSVTLAALLVPMFGAAALIALIPAVASLIAAVRGGVKYLYLIPGTAGAVGLCFVFGLSFSLYGAILAAGLLCGLLLGVAVKARASAMAQTLTVAVFVFAAVAAGVAFAAFTYYGSLSAAVEAAYKSAVEFFAGVSSAVDRAVASYSAADPRGAATLRVASLSGLDPDETVRAIMLALPGLCAFFAFVIGWAEQFLARAFLALYGRRDLITEKRRLALPASLAVIFLILRIVTYFSSGASMFSVCAANVVTALSPAIMIVGAGFIFDMIRAPGSRFSVMFIIMFALSAVFMPAFLLSFLGVAGIVGTIAQAIRRRREKDE